MQHLEIISVLKKIQNLPLEFSQLERSIKGLSEWKKNFTEKEYQMKVLQFEAAHKRSGSLLEKITRISLELQRAQPDFTAAFTSSIMLQRIEELFGEKGLTERMKKQLELVQILEIKNEFKSTHDFIDTKQMVKVQKLFKGEK